jgi:hypothetical protein
MANPDAEQRVATDQKQRTCAHRRSLAPRTNTKQEEEAHLWTPSYGNVLRNWNIRLPCYLMVRTTLTSDTGSARWGKSLPWHLCRPSTRPAPPLPWSPLARRSLPCARLAAAPG